MQLLEYCSRASCLTVELAPTEHGAIMNFNFPSYVKQTAGGLAPGWNQTRRVWVSLDGADGALNSSIGADGLATMIGHTTKGKGKDFKHRFHATISGGADGNTAVTPISAGMGGKGWMFADFDPRDQSTETLVLRVATSLISSDQAALNHKRGACSKPAWCHGWCHGWCPPPRRFQSGGAGCTAGCNRAVSVGRVSAPSGADGAVLMVLVLMQRWPRYHLQTPRPRRR